MIFRLTLKSALFTFIALLIPLSALAQTSSSLARPLPPNVLEKLAFGKTVYIKNEHGSNIAFDAISSDIQGWGRFTLVEPPDKADVLVEINSYEGGGLSSTSNTNYATPDGKPQTSSGTSKNLSGSSVSMNVYEAKTHRELWAGTEKVKSAFKKKSAEDNTVEAAEKLFLRFHDSVEPPQKQ
jgi:hypothetical protein